MPKLSTKLCTAPSPDRAVQRLYAFLEILIISPICARRREDKTLLFGVVKSELLGSVRGTTHLISEKISGIPTSPRVTIILKLLSFIRTSLKKQSPQ